MDLYAERGPVEHFIIQELQKLGWKYVNSEEIKRKWGNIHVLQNRVCKGIMIVGEEG